MHRGLSWELQRHKPGSSSCPVSELCCHPFPQFIAGTTGVLWLHRQLCPLQRSWPSLTASLFETSPTTLPGITAPASCPSFIPSQTLDHRGASLRRCCSKVSRVRDAGEELQRCPSSLVLFLNLRLGLLSIYFVLGSGGA